jgi:hypothetical protein
MNITEQDIINNSPEDGMMVQEVHETNKRGKDYDE